MHKIQSHILKSPTRKKKSLENWVATVSIFTIPCCGKALKESPNSMWFYRPYDLEYLPCIIEIDKAKQTAWILYFLAFYLV